MADNIINKNVIVTPGLNSDKTGLQIFWRLCGVMDKEEVDAAIQDALPTGALPSQVGASKILNRTLDVVKGTAMVRQMGANAYSLVAEDKAKLDLEAAEQLGVKLDPYEVQLNVRIIKDNNGQQTLKFTPESHPQVQTIKDEFERQSHLYHAGLDISAYLSTKVMSNLHAVSMRDRGGIYLIAGAEACATIKRLAQALENISKFDAAGRLLAGCKFYCVPVVFSEDLADVVKDSLIDEVDKLVAETMDKVNAGDLGVRAWQGQGRKVAEQQDKVEKFAKALGVSLGHLTEQLTQLGAAVMAMEMKLDYALENAD